MTIKTTQPARTGSAPTTTSSPADELAQHLAAILHHPETPVVLYNDIQDFLMSSGALERASRTAGFIAHLLDNYDGERTGDLEHATGAQGDHERDH